MVCACEPNVFKLLLTSLIRRGNIYYFTEKKYMFELFGLDVWISRKNLVSREGQKFLNLEVKLGKKAF